MFRISAPTMNPTGSFRSHAKGREPSAKAGFFLWGWCACFSMHASAGDWRGLDAANTIVIETSKGRIVMEWRPDVSPHAVERIKLLTRERLYDGLLFHRVIDGYIAQTGNPNNKDSGSSHPDLPAELTFPLQSGAVYTTVVEASDHIAGFIGATPFEAELPALAAKRNRPPRAWGLYCAGAVGMGHWQDVNTANSEIFFTREPARRLERMYTRVATVVSGLDVVRALTVGEPPAAPDRMIRARVLEDMPESERPKLRVMDTTSAAFGKIVARVRAEKGANFSVCDITVPVCEFQKESDWGACL